MSAIAGVLSRGGAPVNREALAAISSGLHTMGPDDETAAFSPRVGMVHRPFHTDSRSRQSAQPLVTIDGSMLSIDGRLDNVDDLRRRLGSTRALGSDAELVMAAYRSWGCDGFAHLIGDFALSLWDASESRLLLACDGLGRRPLYYYASIDYVYWASRCRPLLSALRIPIAVSEEYVADFLANRTPSSSPFVGIHSVLGGHVLCVDDKGIAVKRYWSFDPGRRVSYRTDEEYASHFAEVFREAVACRLQADSPVFCELSGGLDSSSIACTADRLIREGVVDVPAMQTLSYVFGQSVSSDETPFIETIEGHLGKQGIRVLEENVPVLQPLPVSIVPDIPTSMLAFSARYEWVAQVMKEHGARVMLSGMGGDQAFWSQGGVGLPLADLLVQGRLRDVVDECHAWSRAYRQPFLFTLWRGALRPLLSRGLEASVQSEIPVGEWFDKHFLKRVGFGARMLPMSDDIGFDRPSTARHYGTVRRTMRLFAMEPCLGDSYIDMRYPYLDRRLIEFALAIPLEQISRPTESRSIVRRGLRGVVPHDVLTRRTKSGPSEAFLRALGREWPRLSSLLGNSRLAAHGFVEPHAFATALQRARIGMVTNESQMLRTISLELWLRTLDESSSERRSTRLVGRCTVHDGGRNGTQDQGILTA